MPMCTLSLRRIVRGVIVTMVTVSSNLLLMTGDLRADDRVDYVSEIKPILAAWCYSCHGPLKQEAGLRLDTVAAAVAGGENGTSIVAGDAIESLLIERIADPDEESRMPSEGKPLSDRQIALLTAWIRQGAHAPQDERPLQNPREFWSFQPVNRPTVPTVKDINWTSNPIDAFVAAGYERHKLKPRPLAEKSTLLRRVYLDLIGLPPTREQLHAFLADGSPDAYEKVVDALLASPQYGERWGRHWMDVWRYSDWYGRRANNEIRYSQRHIWRWRDWIIESLNEDKGYDRMIVEMLAGDELAPDNPDVLRATGYLGRSWYKFDRNVWLSETIEKTSMGFLGVTMKCARCHDHKTDPISQTEYYRLRAFFEPHGVRVDPISAATTSEVDNKKDTVLKDGLARVYDATPEAPTYVFFRGDDRSPLKDNPLTAAIPEVLARKPIAIEPVALPLSAYYPSLAPRMVESLVAKAEADVRSAQSAHAKNGVRLQALRDQSEALHGDSGSADKPPQRTAGKVFLADDFAKARPDVWKPLGGQWKYENGHVAQTQVGTFLTMVTQQNHPQDFQARIKYRTLEAGDVHSVGMSFDVVDERDWQAIYTHVKEGTSAVHAFHRKNGKDAYPSIAIVPHPLQFNQTVTLDFAVRGQVLNIWIDGELKLAYTMPQARQPGRFALWVHSGTAEFDEVTIEALPAEFALVSTTTQKLGSPFSAPMPEDIEAQRVAAELAVTHSEKKVASAQARLRSVNARIAAERARVSAAADVKQLALAAGRAEREAALATADESLHSAEQALRQLQAAAGKKDDKALAAATKKRDAAKTAVDKAQTALKIESDKYAPLGTEYPRTSTGRRLALARWIASADNPRTARVAVNQMWLRHFGSAIVPSVADFGLKSKPRSHPALLDWLADELVEHDWSMKHMHRLMVTSTVYRLKSSNGSDDNPNLKIDPHSRFLWRANSRRMEAEIIRDSLLAAAGQLDRTLGGPELGESLGQSSRRRSLYFRTTPDNKMQMLELFDLANPNECFRRKESVVPQQALAMTNSPVALSQARELARKIAAQSDGRDAADFIVAAFEQVLTRRPSDEEQAACTEFLKQQTTLLQDSAKLTAFPDDGAKKTPPSADPSLRARENLVHVLFSHNDFVTIR